ncbi:cleavage and polyadenylation specificity factor subunit 4-like [Pomacea canaliculata]|uniref:cleavage and polyadenylation specificity factor subunit 4-like n=1 Tax=Pomacea canaliculata TaxID=400727 RepID=UPI000D73C9F6|nr:cleavage and polyadenylation specificity factor subunit 4-like [Pomacea canaliculata]
MQELVAPVSDIKFDIEFALDQQIGSLPLPFPGMDKSGSAICTFFLSSVCNKGTACPFRHVKGDRTVVCKHWLRGLCKKGDDCEFLHEYDMSKMPECYFFSKFGQCSNKECPFLHIDPENKIKDCPWYDRGFCRHGPNCKNRHVRRVICQCFLNGFCLDGPDCKYVHPSFDIPAPDPQQQAKKAAIVCHMCGEAGHKALHCPRPIQPMAWNLLVQSRQESQSGTQETAEGRRPLDQVTCFKCGEKGHYANKCPKGHLAFLSATAH